MNMVGIVRRRTFAWVCWAAACLGSMTCGPASAQVGAPWTDVHVHLIGGSTQRVDYGAAIGVALAAMDESGVRTSVVMPPPQIKEMALHDWREFAALLQRHPCRFAFLGGGGTLNVMLHEAAKVREVDAAKRAEFARVAQEILSAGAAGFGEMAAHHLSLQHGHAYEWVAPDHPLLLLLADIAARNNAVIDLHLDLVPSDTGPPPRLQSTNPAVLRENRAAFERLLAHNRQAKIVWAHAGSDPLGNWTWSLSRELLAAHPNLYMSLRLPGRMPGRVKPGAAGGFMPHFIVGPGGDINPGWLRVLREFPDRFVIGSDQFFANPAMSGSGPGLDAARFNANARALTRRLIEQMPPDLARPITIDNAAQLYRLQTAR